MLLFRGLWSLLFSLMLVASCRGSVESVGRKALIDVQYDISNLYFGYVFAGENKMLLETIMVSARKVYDRDEQYQSLESHFTPDSQKEDRQRLLTSLVQEAIRHTIAKVTGDNGMDDSRPCSPSFHFLQVFNSIPALEESRDVIDWYQNQPVLLQGILAEDRTDSMENLIQEAVKNSFREFPSHPLTWEQLLSRFVVKRAFYFEPLTRVQLAWQLGYILLEMQELFLRGRALRSLSYKIEQQKQNPEIANDPAFTLYLSFLTELFNSNDTLWHIESLGSKWLKFQGGLSVLFSQAANHENYGLEFYKLVRRILDSGKLFNNKPVNNKPVNNKPVNKKPVNKEPVRKDYVNMISDLLDRKIGLELIAIFSMLMINAVAHLLRTAHVYEMFVPRV
ncbi:MULTISPECIES: hypothetical protein [unclassified Endozoicomonas]|uniref:hypothetical protein n=1 Tax=unclassified Endozoicomonas TaxID=2644528 RepID=UPI003BB6F330